tara:strand:- start:343 stop:537 length:195 start_codon:yes stop_codon:yes gene_type:complete
LSRKQWFLGAVMFLEGNLDDLEAQAGCATQNIQRMDEIRGEVGGYSHLGRVVYRAGCVRKLFSR